MLRTGAGWLAERDAFPTSLRAILGYYAHSGVFDYGSLRLKRQVDAEVDEIVRSAFSDVEEAIAEEYGYDGEEVSFTYDTKLVMPAKLSLGYLYREHGESKRDRAASMTRLIVEALIDGDMRDAINDDEYDDFTVGFETTGADLREIARIAQETLQTRVERQFSQFPDTVRDRYERAVRQSERHQERDPYFREVMANADGGALETIGREYKYGEFDDVPDLFTREDLELPYLKTQYNRVGVIYSGMIGMYRAAGLPIEDAFERSIILAIIGAQIWLDDVDDYWVDRRDNQLTPVTAEYLLNSDDRAARDAVVDITGQYLDRARRQATVADSTLTGIAIEYIARQGTPDALPPDGQGS